ncbi:hypothetical protein FEM03_20785 [Phragmitibacter flavus]|uniref:Uncharacterized protein n=1 Tax=Phragmitibacter flavus TaxID=2576071 RepID=A0A5R8K8X8_9BACT|nr:hypothetical protein [Phragmitibacter flavus]TLD68773.1 hypothetical protein FEM03_20785 [Phragmitibacter flavus]
MRHSGNFYLFRLGPGWRGLVTLADGLVLAIAWMGVILSVGGVFVLCVWWFGEMGMLIPPMVAVAGVFILLRKGKWGGISRMMRRLGDCFPGWLVVMQGCHARVRYHGEIWKLSEPGVYGLRPGCLVFFNGTEEQWDRFDPMAM